MKDHLKALRAKAQEQAAGQTERKAKALESIRKQCVNEKELGATIAGGADDDRKSEGFGAACLEL